MIDSLLIFFYNGLGDAFLALPTLRALATLSSRTTIATSLNDPRFQLILKDVDKVDIVGIHLEEKVTGKFIDVNELCELRKNYQWFVCLNEWYPPSAQYQQMCAGPRCLGAFNFFNISIPRPAGLHTIDYLFHFAQHFDSHLSLEKFCDPPAVPGNYLRIASDFKHKLPDRRIMVIHADTQKQKMWPETCIEEFISTVLTQYPHFLIVMIGVAIPAMPTLENETRVIKLEDTDFRLPWAMTATADIFLGVDSVFLHIADFYDVPVIGLFGPTDPALWGCRLTPHFLHVCSPTEDMGEIQPANVIQQFDQMVTTHA